MDNLISDNNLDFYEKITPEVFQSFSEQIGMHTCNDVRLIYPSIENTEKIIELGSGYGRVIDFLLSQGFKGDITAIERSNTYCNYLKEKYDNKIDVSHQDIKALELNFTVDAILWMWSGITEFSPREQLVAVKRCYNVLKVGGTLFIEAPYQSIHYVGEMDLEKAVKVETEWGTLQAYLTGQEEVQEYSKESKFRKLEIQTYKTQKNIERVVYMLHK